MIRDSIATSPSLLFVSRRCSISARAICVRCHRQPPVQFFLSWMKVVGKPEAEIRPAEAVFVSPHDLRVVLFDCRQVLPAEDPPTYRRWHPCRASRFVTLSAKVASASRLGRP